MRLEAENDDGSTPPHSAASGHVGVARLLLDMSEEVNGQKVVTKRLPKQDIAKMIGASREMVSRVMKDLQMGGYIEMRGSTIVLRDTILLPD